ncbi:type I CRISPR-associated protein Cas7 [Vagococcus humatus]|nr:type I CRISPR-associated protein Cas7 [Vagococcus humatus]
MTMKKNNSTGFIGVITNMASFNNEVGDNAGSRRTSKGDFYATHYKMKWLIRDYFARLNGNKSVLVKSSAYKHDKTGNLAVRTLEQRIKYLFDLDDDDFKNLTSIDLLNLVLSKKDVKNFGVALPIDKKQVKVTGVTQLSYAINNYKETEEQIIQINGAYSTKEGNLQATLGRRKFLDFANYIYNFTVQPNMLSKNVLGVEVEPYTLADYNWFKKGALRAAQTNQSSSTGSYVGYGMFIELKENEDLIQPNFNHYISTTKKNDVYLIDFTLLANYLAQNEQAIHSIELYLAQNIQLEFIGLDALEKNGVEIKDMAEARKINIEE